MRGWLIALTGTALVACGHAGPRPGALAPQQAGCWILGPEATVYPYRFPDTLELAAEWFLPEDSTGGRLRVVRPRDASLATYRRYLGRFWWESREDSIVVTKSDGASGSVLATRLEGETLVGTLRTFGPAASGASRAVRAGRVSCDSISAPAPAAASAAPPSPPSSPSSPPRSPFP